MLTEADCCQTPRLWGWYFTMQPRQSILASCHQKDNYLAFLHPYPFHSRWLSSVLTVSQFGEPEEAENLPEARMCEGAEGRRGTWSLLFRDTFVSDHFSCTGRLPGVTGTKLTEAITSRYSSSSSSSSLNYFSLFPLSANLQNCAHWTTYMWLCLNPVLQDNLDFKDLGWTVCSESALKGRMGQHLQGVGARRKQTPRAWLCFQQLFLKYLILSGGSLQNCVRETRELYST